MAGSRIEPSAAAAGDGFASAIGSCHTSLLLRFVCLRWIRGRLNRFGFAAVTGISRDCDGLWA